MKGKIPMVMGVLAVVTLALAAALAKSRAPGSVRATGVGDELGAAWEQADISGPLRSPRVADQAVQPQAQLQPLVVKPPDRLTGKVLVLVGEDISPERLPELGRDEQGRPVTVEIVHTSAALRAALDATTVAIVVESGAKEAADWAWIQQRFSEGRAIAGLNINMGELLQLLYPASSSVTDGEDSIGWKRGPNAGDLGPGRKFYAVLASSPACWSGITGQLDQGFSDSFLQDLRYVLACVPPLYIP